MLSHSFQGSTPTGCYHIKGPKRTDNQKLLERTKKDSIVTGGDAGAVDLQLHAGIAGIKTTGIGGFEWTTVQKLCRPIRSILLLLVFTKETPTAADGLVQARCRVAQTWTRF